MPNLARINGFTSAVRRAGIEVRQARAAERAANLAPIVEELQASGITSLKGIAKALNDRGVPTPAGQRHWHPMQVARLLRRLAG
jgi:recombinase-like protein